MTTAQMLAGTWRFDPLVVVACAAAVVTYAAATRFQDRGRTAYFLGGVVVILIALESPIHTLGDHYLFCAHMLQHLLLLLLAPPLVLLGTPPEIASRALRWKPARLVECTLARPVPAWMIGILTMCLWHIPFLYNITLRNHDIHLLEHTCFLVSAFFFWWPVCSPLQDRLLSGPLAALYLFAAGVVNCVLGMVLTFAPVGLFPAYLKPMDMYGLLPLIRNQWGITPALDQQWGGLIMWVPGCLVYVVAAMAALLRWYNEPDDFADALPIAAAGPGDAR